MQTGLYAVCSVTVGGKLWAGFRIKTAGQRRMASQVTMVIVKTEHISPGNAMCAQLWYNATANYACLHRSLIKAFEFQTQFFYPTKVWLTKTPINLSVESRCHNTASEEAGIIPGLTAGRRNKDNTNTTTTNNLKDTFCPCNSTAGLLTGWALSPQTHKNTVLGLLTSWENRPHASTYRLNTELMTLNLLVWDVAVSCWKWANINRISDTASFFYWNLRVFWCKTKQECFKLALLNEHVVTRLSINASLWQTIHS